MTGNAGFFLVLVLASSEARRETRSVSSPFTSTSTFDNSRRSFPLGKHGSDNLNKEAVNLMAEEKLVGTTGVSGIINMNMEAAAEADKEYSGDWADQYIDYVNTELHVENAVDKESRPRQEKSLIGNFRFPGREEVHGDFPQTDINDNNLVDAKKFSLLADLALQGDTNETVEDDGRRCIKKVMMIEETEYEEVLTCDHSYDNRCHTSYVTKYEPHQEEECEEKFKKTCFIDYEQKAYSETVQVCTTPWAKNCNATYTEEDLDCRTVYETECSTRQTVHEVEDDVATCTTVEDEECREVTEGFTVTIKCDKWPREECSVRKEQVRKYTPDTTCQKVARQMCAPPDCPIVEGEVQCRDKVQTVVVDNPVEECDMEPINTCKHITKLVPRLVASLECVDVPKEICARSKINPTRVQRPAIQKWCYRLEEGDVLASSTEEGSA